MVDCPECDGTGDYSGFMSDRPCPRCDGRGAIVGIPRHTPGPWVAVGHAIYGPVHKHSNYPNGRVFIARVAEGTHRADPRLEGGADRFEFDSEADVRLIKAAPKLLAALKGILESTDSDAIGKFESDAAYSAIAEVEGEESK